MTASNITKGDIGKLLYTEDLRGLAGKLAEWRRNPTVRLMKSTRDKGRILDFITGLRLSTQIAYIVRQVVSSLPDLEVSWGHLVDNKGNSCSAECDIIVHRKGHIQRWNGGESPMMDFRFIHCEKALAVISCKSFTKNIDKEYPSEIAKYGVDNVFLVAECCSPNKVTDLSDKAKEAGYSGFYYLYQYDEKSFTDTIDSNVYVEFIQKLLALNYNPKNTRKKPANRKK